MLVGVGASGFVGIAIETTMGTYAAPTKFFPIRSESMAYNQETTWRRVIRGVADVIGAVAGYSHVAGDIEMEVLPDVLPYFLKCSRNTVVKAGAAPYTYTTTPSAASQPPGGTMSITVVKNGQVFGFVGCVVGSMEFGVDSGMGTVTFSIVGIDETVQSMPTPVWANQSPYGVGSYSIQVPTATQVFDVESFTFSIEDNAEPQQRLANYRKAAYVMYGEREVTIHMDRDFVNRTEFDVFKALTASSVTITMSNGANSSVSLKAAAAIRDTFDLGGLSGQGDVIRSAIDWRATYDATSSKAYEITVITTENLT